jgi:FkbM family methyltransferase
MATAVILPSYVPLSLTLNTPSGPCDLTFEPAPGNYPRLVRHLELNGCENVVPLHLAAGDAPGRVTLHLNADNDGGYALWDVRAHHLNGKSPERPAAYDVWLTRIACVVGPRPVRAMKLDIEGSEAAALRGAEPLLTGPDTVPFVIAGSNRGALIALGSSESELRDRMDARGDDTWLLQMAEPQLQRVEPNVTVEGNFVFNVLFWRRGATLP